MKAFIIFIALVNITFLKVSYANINVNHLISEINLDSIIIERISKHVLAIETLSPSFQKISEKTTAKATEGGVLNYYYNDNHILKKMELIYYGEWGKTITYYYFRDNDLIELDYIDIRYDKPIYFDDSKEFDRKITKYYINNFTVVGIKHLNKLHFSSELDEDTISVETFINRLLLILHEVSLNSK